MSKILIIRLTSLGDVIFTLPLVNVLSTDNEIGYVVSEKGLDVIKDNPMIRNVHFVPLAKWKKNPFSFKNLIEFVNVIKEIRAEKYDIAIDCQQMLKSLLLLLFSGAKRRITFKDARELSVFAGNEFVTPKAKFRDNNYHIVERNLDFARHLNCSIDDINFELPKSIDSVVEKIDNLLKNIDKNKKTVVISPATTWENKHWAEKNWAEVIKSINGKCNIVFSGTSKDIELVDRIIKQVGDIDYINLCGETNVKELLEVFKRANLVIAPDSGSAHLAWASSIPHVIAIFTCTPPKRFGPYGKSGKYFAVQGELPCQPCFKRKCRLKQSKNICCLEPSVDKIINIVNKIIQ